MTKTKSKELAVVDESTLAELGGAVAQEASYTRMLLPRLSFASKDKTEEVGTGKNKKINVLMAAGTYFIERETEETVTREDGTEGKVWDKEEFDEETPPEGIIIFKRKQLRYYDDEEGFTSSPIFGGEDGEDEENDIISLFKGGKRVDQGTVKELQKKYPHKLSKKGAKIPQLALENILYVILDGELLQMNLKGSSQWAFRDYTKKVKVATVITRFTSEENEVGDNRFNSMQFNSVRPLTADEAQVAVAKLREIKQAINDEKAYFAGLTPTDSNEDEEEATNKNWKELTTPTNKKKANKPF